MYERKLGRELDEDRVVIGGDVAIFFLCFLLILFTCFLIYDDVVECAARYD
jgi:hypothetical protein